MTAHDRQRQAMTVTVTHAPVWLACADKHPFESAAVAAHVAARQNRAKKHRKSKQRPLSSYRCQHCGLYHIGGEGRL